MTATAEPIAGATRHINAYEVSIAHDFDALLRSCPSLSTDPADSDLFSSCSWFENLSRHGIEPGLQRLLVIVRQRTNGAVFCLPLLQRPRGTAAFFGPVLGSLSNYYSSLYGVIGDPRHVSVGALRAAFAHLRRHHRRCSVIDLHPLDTGHPFHAMACQALTAEGYLTDTYFCFGNWHLDVAGRSFAMYEQGIPTRLRTKRVANKLDRAGAWQVEVHQAPGPALDAAIADFQAVYAQSWRDAEPYPRFVQALCRTAATQGWLRLGVLRLEGRPIAAQLWIIKGSRALIYKIAYDEEFKRLSPGSVLSSKMMRRAIDEERVVDVDYLTGDDAYKVDWMSHRRERVGMLAFRKNSLQGLLSALRHFGGRWWRQRQQRRTTGAVAA